jgi:Branched-chain polyamine synthase A C-terminal domain
VGGDTLLELLAGYGAAGRPVRQAVARLTERPWAPADLVAATGLPRREVEALLRALGDDLAEAGGAAAIRPELVPAYRDRFGYRQLHRTALDDPLARLLADRGDLRDRIAHLVAGAPPPLRDLDHVPATPETVARRALWLDGTFDLAGATLLCVGDHDLTGPAAALANPDLAVTVVDIDERLLAYIDTRCAGVRCLYADLRAGLPPAALGSADLVFTDPPYTPDGVRLFLARGLQGLRDREHGRVMLAYGYGGQPGLGGRVQEAVRGLRVAYEAILPGFNRYRGAQAVGSASDLYVCRPTARTWPALERAVVERAAGEALGIYTHGPQSVEAGGSPAGEPRAALRAELAGLAGAHTAVIGPGGLPLAEVVAGTAAARLPRPRVLVADLADDPGAWLLRLLLALEASRLTVLVPNGHPDVASERGQRELAGLVGSKYALRFRRSTPDGRHAVVEASQVLPEQLDAGDRAVRYVLDRAHARLAGSWRDGLLRARRAAGRPLARQQAAAIVEAAGPGGTLLELRPIEIPRHRLAALLDQVRATALA